ncbi:hypothetical protein JX266_008713 [Neoarthrinium moseri]|nr:hypothetical protein JX266_008713 [Neoarthrinium moseri]
MIVQKLPVTQSLHLTAVPLTREAFAPFGDVLSNPRPGSLPSNTSPASIAAGALPCGAISANQGTAIQYKGLGSMHNLYPSAPSKAAATPRVTMFVCGARELAGPGRDTVEVKVLERHPFTTQTFVPLNAGKSKGYLVIVAPTLAPGVLDEGLPVPTGEEAARLKLPGRGVPDVGKLRAFIANGDQAVTYGAGTWHAPMIALGETGSAIDFVVVQFANDTAVEDCQEVTLGSGESSNSRITANVPGRLRLSKL